jgi:hypothetical protein
MSDSFGSLQGAVFAWIDGCVPKDAWRNGRADRRNGMGGYEVLFRGQNLLMTL